MSQLWRKAEKAFDLEFVIKQAKIYYILNRAILSHGQKLLIKFQMENFVGQEDQSESSDNLQDVFKAENSEKILSEIFDEFSNKKLERLDAQLLRGVFTNNRDMLKIPNHFQKGAKIMEKDKPGFESIFRKKGYMH